MSIGAYQVLSTDISVDYPLNPGVLRNISIDVFAGEIVGLIGQSGSGKSTLALAIPRLLGHTGARIRGRILLLGKDLMLCDERSLRAVRGRLVSLVPQSPAAALNPALRIGTHFREAWLAHSREPWDRHTGDLSRLLTSAGLPSDKAFLRRFPGEISVGQAQRVLIVMALLHRPPLLIADEPTSALDLITQREVLLVLAAMGRENQTSILFISHDLLAVAAICSRIAILHEGEIVESGPTKDVLRAPQHPYTSQLVNALPSCDF
jgi:ABC-type glutathione transport system ATPase component